ncbi:MAG TPA: DMT family transporter [Burkholderiales bacterium]|nr:DMT family transporter [Burkholderiales bacterium]
MRRADATRLVALAALWGASFLFMRIAAPVLGPFIVADARILLAAAALGLYFRWMRFDTGWRRWWRVYTLVGVINTGLPFLLYAYAALHIPAGLSAVANATAPMWGTLLAATVLRERLSNARLAGLALGILGVALVTRPQPGAAYPLLAVAAALGGAFCYAVAGIYLKRRAHEAPGRGMAFGTQLAAGILLVPFAAASQPLAPVTPLALSATIAMALLSGAVAYVLYFRLIADIGPIRALTVTYLIPVFGVLFGAVFLGEALGPSTLAGGLLVVLGTALVLRK